MALEKENEITEDGAWLRKAGDNIHINLAELNAVVKGVNLAMKWNPQVVAIMTDSGAVYSWMSSMQKKDKCIKVSGLSEMLVRRRLSILLETLEAYNVQWNVFLVPTTKNKADDLTQVPKHWLKNSADSVGAVALSARGGVEDTRLEAKDTKKIRGQGQGQPFRGQTLSRPRTGMLEAKAKGTKKIRGQAQGQISEDRHSRGQGQECSRPRTQAQVLSKKKKGLHKNFSGDLQKKKGLHKNFSSDPHEKTFSKKFFKRSSKF